MLYRDAEVPGFVHLSIGQEASPSVCSDCGRRTSSPRPIAATPLPGQGCRHGGDVRRADGSRRWGVPWPRRFNAHRRSRPRHPRRQRDRRCRTADRRRRGCRIPPSGDDAVTVAFFGDGALAAGAFHEAVNLAAVDRLPVLFVCENNHYAEFSPTETQHPVTPIERMAAYAVPGSQVDGNDVEAVAELAAEHVAALRAGEGPRFIEALTYRWHGHYEGDPSATATPTRSTSGGPDPVACVAHVLDDAGQAELRATIDHEVDDEVDVAVATARSSPEPSPSTVTDYVERPRPDVDEGKIDPDAPLYRTMDALAPHCPASCATTRRSGWQASTWPPAEACSGSPAALPTSSLVESSTRRSRRSRSWAWGSAQWPVRSPSSR